MTKDELMQMARDAGFPFNKYGLLQGDDEGEIDADAMLERLTNAILERAAMGFEDDDEWQESRYTGRAVSGKIRALKINTGD